MSEQIINPKDVGKFILDVIESYGIDVFESNPILLEEVFRGEIKEEWKDIKGYENYYQISSFGRIRSCERKIDVIHFQSNKNIKKPIKGGLKFLQNTQAGYKIVNLYKEGHFKGLTVHRLVAEHFIPNYENKPQVNHKDGNKKNNYYLNLEWCTPSENMYHSCRVLKRKLPHSAYIEGQNHVQAKPLLVRKSGEIFCVFSHSTQAAEYSVTKSPVSTARSRICQCARKEWGRKRFFGYEFEYISKKKYKSLKDNFPPKILTQ